MANKVPVFGWLCTDSQLSTMVEALLDEKYPEPLMNLEHKNEYRLGRLGSSNIIIRSLSEPYPPTDATGMAQSMVKSFSGIDAILLTGFGGGSPNAGIKFGDLVISPLTSRHDSDTNSTLTSTSDIVQHAANILKREVGADGYWLLNKQSLDISDFSQEPVSCPSDCPQLHYGSFIPEIHDARKEKLQIQLAGPENVIYSDTEAAGIRVKNLLEYVAMSDIKAIGLTELPVPVIVILGIGDLVDSNESKTWRMYAAANAVSYGKEFIQVMINNTRNGVPDLKGTEKLVPPHMIPTLPTFQLHRYPRNGDAILLVVPTENESKKKILQETFENRARADVKMHTITISSDSCVGEQPYNEAGIIGAHNRISNALLYLDAAEYQETLKEKQIGTIIVASIESFIQTDNVDRPADYGLIVIHNATTQQTTACISEGVTVPPAYVNRARRFGFDQDPNHGRVTVGQILAAHIPGLDKANWQSVLARHSRYDLLKDAIMQVSIPW